MIEIFNCEQGSPEWFACRLGIPTASNFATVMAKGEGKTRRTYLLKLIGERLTGDPSDSYSNAHIERGQVMEAEARALYTFMTDVEPEQVGFIRDGNKGCSPDGLIGTAGMTEIKTKLAHIQLEVLLADRLPPEHAAQCQGNLWVANREWIDFCSYWPKLPLFIKRVYRDEIYIKKLASEVDAFNDEMMQLIGKIDPSRAAA